MAQNDMALVIGIEKYPTFGGNASDAARDLEGPANDAEVFVSWLKATDGGNVPDANIQKVTSKDFGAGSNIGPVLQNLTDTLDKLKADAKSHPVKRRLYIYVSGHGYGRFRTDGGLYLADATPNSLSNIYVSRYFMWFVDAGYFDECILFCDACMDQGRLAAPTEPHWLREVPIGKTTRAMGAYAARFPGRAVETIKANGQVHGAFSYALWLGLKGAAAVEDTAGKRTITTASLRDYVIATMHKLMTDAQRQHPLVSTEPDFGPFDTVTLVENAPVFTASLRVLVPGSLSDASLRLADDALTDLGSRTATNGELSLTLSPGFYVLTGPGGWEEAFEFTGAETEVDLR